MDWGLAQTPKVSGMDVQSTGGMGQLRTPGRVRFFALLTILSGIATAPVCAGLFTSDTTPQGSRNIAGIAPITDSGGTFRLRHFVGDGVGIQDSSSSLGAFLPLSASDEFIFFDGQYSLTNEANSVGNLGLGFREFNPANNRFWGVSLWYDVDDRNFNTFQQAGATFELVGDIWDLRGNAYVPIGRRQQTSGDPVLSGGGLMFQGTSLAVGALLETETAYDGFDLELGRIWYGIPIAQCIRTAVGFYHFQGDDNPHIYGVRGRVEGSLTQNIDLGLTIQNDREFDTNLIFGVTWRFGGAARNRIQGCSYSARNRLRRSVPRNQQIVVTRGYTNTFLAATNPVNGQAIHIIHVDSSAGPGGDGTLARPFQTLAEAEAGSVAGNVIYAHADSVFLGESIRLLPDQQFLGEGVDHYINTQQLGSFMLPRATSGTSLPLIQDSPDVAVELNSNTVVSGIRVDNAGEIGIGGISVNGDVSINRNIITNSAEVGIGVQDFVGNLSIVDNQISDTAMLGLVVGDPGGGGSTGNVTISRNTVTNTDDEFAVAVSGVTGDILINENIVTDSEGLGIGVIGFNGNATIVDNQVSDIEEMGIIVGDPGGGGSAGNVLISRNNVNNTNTDAGIGAAGVIGDVIISDNAIANTGSTGIFAYQIDGDVLLSNNDIINAGDEGAFAGLITGNVVATDNEVQGCGDFGFQFFSVNDGVLFQNNVVNNAVTEGAIFANVDGGVTVTGNQFTNLGSAALRFQGGTGNVITQGNVIDNVGDIAFTIAQVNGNIDVSNETISNVAREGIMFFENTGDISVTGNSIHNTGDAGLFFVGNGGTAIVQSNTLTAVSNFGILFESRSSTFTGLAENNTFGTVANPLSDGLRFFSNGSGTLNVTARNNSIVAGGFTMFADTASGTTFNLNLNDNTGNGTYMMDMRAAGSTFNLGGLLGTGSSFSDSDNGNVANNGNTTSGGAPTVTALGTINIVAPASIPTP